MRPFPAFLITSCLVTVLGACHEDRPLTLAPLQGIWSNEDAATPGVDTVKIDVQGSMVLVRMWGACVPMDCYWGQAVADQSEWQSRGVLHVTWDPGFAIETQDLSLPSSGRLRVTTSTHFTDNSGRADSQRTDYFRHPTQSGV